MGKNCKKNSLLSGYIDGELSPKDSDAMAAHIEQCEFCQREMSRIQQADSLLMGIKEIEPSESFDRTFWKKIDALNEPTHRWNLARLITGKWHWRPYALSGALACFLIIVIVFGKTGYEPDINEMLVAENLELFQEYDVVNKLDLLENWDVISEMPEGS